MLVNDLPAVGSLEKHGRNARLHRNILFAPSRVHVKVKGRDGDITKNVDLWISPTQFDILKRTEQGYVARFLFVAFVDVHPFETLATELRKLVGLEMVPLERLYRCGFTITKNLLLKPADLLLRFRKRKVGKITVCA